MKMKSEKTNALLALALLLPVPSLGALCGMVFFPGTALGAGLFFAAKIYVFALPVFWHLCVDKRKISQSAAKHGGWLPCAAIGLLLSAAVYALYLLLGDDLLDKELIQTRMKEIGLANPLVYLICATYGIFINSVLEEMVWRWFVVEKAKKVTNSAAAIFISALGFTIHHGFAMRVYCDWPAVLIACAGIFIGGAIWSWCYLKYRSIRPVWLSHAIVDVTIFTISWFIIF